MSISVAKDLRSNFGPVRDQDPRPTCMAFAASDAHAGARPGWEPLSVEWAYFHALKRDGVQPHQGVHLATMLATLRSDGQPAETHWPYIAKLFTDFAAWHPPKMSDRIFRRESKPAAATLASLFDHLELGPGGSAVPTGEDFAFMRRDEYPFLVRRIDGQMQEYPVSPVFADGSEIQLLLG